MLQETYSHLPLLNREKKPIRDPIVWISHLSKEGDIRRYHDPISAIRKTRLTEDILDITRIESQTLELKKEE